MPVTINGNGSITGLAVGGLPDGSVDADTLASNSVTAAKLQSGSVIQSVTKMGTGCYNMTNTSWGTELSTDFRVTLPTVQASNSKILILFLQR